MHYPHNHDLNNATTMTTIRITNNRSIAFSFILLTFLSSLQCTQTNSEKCNDCTCISSTIDCANISLPIITVRTPEAVTPQQATTTNHPPAASKDDVLKVTIDKSTELLTSQNVSKDSSAAAIVKQVSNDNDVSELMIDLSRRNLTSLLGLFRTLHLATVQLLNLSANHLDVLVDSGFSGLSSLKCLDLAENNVSLIQDNAFASLGSLQHLNLSRNSLKSLQDDTFKGLASLQQLDLSFNELSSIAPGSLELSSLTRLVLAGNVQLGNGESPLFLATGKRLQTMDASSISLALVPSALTHSIRTLHIAENRITSISRGDMDSYPLLQLLDVTSNDLLEIEEDALGRLEMLTILYLTNNHLSSIPHSLPERLKILHLESNNIEVLRPHDLDGMSQLEVLLLNGNRIKRVADGAFSQMAALVSLDLSANPLRELPAGILAGPLGLRVLRLGQLNVSMPAAVKETAFPLPSTEHLITLDVSGSPAVARQWLADTAALAASRELQELDLSGCAIEWMPTDMFYYLPQLRSLHLKENMLNCSGLEWLAEWMRRQEVEEYREVYCQSPGELWGTLLVDLQSLQETNSEAKTTYPQQHFVETATTSVTTTTTTMSSATTNFTETDAHGAKAQVNPYIMNILREDAKVTTPAATHQQPPAAVGEKTNRILKVAGAHVEQNDVLDAPAIKSTVWPKAIKTVTITSNTNIPFTTPTSSSSTSSTRRSNLFMKNSSTQKPVHKEHVEHDDGIMPKTNSKRIKSMSLVENQQHRGMENNTTSTGSSNKGEASMYSTMVDNERHAAHPGMYLLIIGILGASLVLITVTSRMSRRTRDDLQELRAYQQDQGDLIEVSSLPSVAELW